MESFNEATNLANNSIYQEFEEKASIKTIIKSEQSTIKSSNNKRNETFPQIAQKNEICKIVPTSGMPISKSCIINSNVSFSQYFLKKENVNTSQITDLSNWKSSNYFLYYLYGIYELSLALFNPNTISKDLKVFQESPKKNDFFGQGEINSFGMVIIYDINKINDEYYKYEFHKITNYISTPHDHFIESVNKVIESIKNAYIYVDLKLYGESEQLLFGDLDSSEQLNDGNYKSINEEDVIYLFIYKSFIYKLYFNFSLINNFKNRNKVKIDINLYFSKNIKYGSSFGDAFSKIINEYSIIHQILKDILIKGYYFILFQEKIELYKVIPLIKNRKKRILYFISSERNLIDDFLDKTIAKRSEQIEQSDYLLFCNNRNNDFQ
jgi:hypothetical protein